MLILECLEIVSVDIFVFVSSIWVLEVVNDSMIWWVGFFGKYGYSLDGG